MFAHQGTTTGSGIAYLYDMAGRLTKETTYGRFVVSDLDEAGNRIRVTWPDWGYWTYLYDAANRLTEIRESGAGTGYYRTTFNTYGPLNQRATSVRGNTTQATYAYDPVGRLTGLTQGASTTATASIQTLAYNPASQLSQATQATVSYVWTGHPTTTINTTPDGLNRDAAIATAGGYDANGNLISDGTRTFTYDVENHLTSVTGGAAPLTLTYDPAGRLYQTTSGSTVTQFLWEGDKLIAEYNATSGAMTQRYVHGVGTDEPVLWRDGDTIRRWLHADRQGSIIATSDQSGVTSPITYGPYGEPQTWAGSRFRYTGQLALPEAQLYYYKARVYDPMTGRFLQTDPIGQADDPNLYAYVKGDPENRTDPSGEAGNCPDSCPTTVTPVVVTGQRPPAASPPLAAHTGLAGTISRAINTIASGPQSKAQLNTPGQGKTPGTTTNIQRDGARVSATTKPNLGPLAPAIKTSGNITTGDHSVKISNVDIKTPIGSHVTNPQSISISDKNGPLNVTFGNPISVSILGRDLGSIPQSITIPEK